MLKPKAFVFFGAFLLGIAQVRPISTGWFMGKFTSMLSVPLVDKVM
jgi:hypothetical protein